MNDEQLAEVRRVLSDSFSSVTAIELAAEDLLAEVDRLRSTRRGREVIIPDALLEDEPAFLDHVRTLLREGASVRLMTEEEREQIRIAEAILAETPDA